MNNTAQTNSKLIVATKVPVRERCGCFPNLFGSYFIATENTIYSFADNLVQGYKGEFWDFFRLSNGGFFIAPTKALLYDVRVSFGNDFRGEMSARATGVVVCIFAYSFLAEKTRNSLFITQTDRLKDYANEHPEGTSIFAAID